MCISQIIKDIAAIVIVLGGLFVMIMEIIAYFRCVGSYRGLFLVKALAGFSCAALYIAALFRLYPAGSDTIAPIAGRPVFVLILLSLALDGIYNSRASKGC